MGDYENTNKRKILELQRQFDSSLEAYQQHLLEELSGLKYILKKQYIPFELKQTFKNIEVDQFYLTPSIQLQMSSSEIDDDISDIIEKFNLVQGIRYRFITSKPEDINANFITQDEKDRISAHRDPPFMLLLKNITFILASLLLLTGVAYSCYTKKTPNFFRSHGAVALEQVENINVIIVGILGEEIVLTDDSDFEPRLR